MKKNLRFAIQPIIDEDGVKFCAYEVENPFKWFFRFFFTFKATERVYFAVTRDVDNYGYISNLKGEDFCLTTNEFDFICHKKVCVSNVKTLINIIRHVHGNNVEIVRTEVDVTRLE